MLTSHHYLLGGLFAVMCALSTAPREFNADIAYRGSGRLDEQPVGEKHTRGNGFIAHRGSGRVSTHPG